MYTTRIHIDAAGISHIRALMENLGESEFRRQYPNIEVYDFEVEIRSETEDGAHVELARIANADIPEKRPSVAIDELRRSNERLAAQNRALLEQLDQEQSRANRKAFLAATIVGLLGVIVTLFVGMKGP